VIFTSELQHMSKTMVDRWKPTKQNQQTTKNTTKQNKTNKSTLNKTITQSITTNKTNMISEPVTHQFIKTKHASKQTSKLLQHRKNKASSAHFLRFHAHVKKLEICTWKGT
jgi:hypothetical protein